jgi:flagellar hook-length control protein FliK
MQPFLGVTPAKALRTAPPSDAPSGDTRATPANRQAFRSALDAAHERSGGSERAERRAGRPNEVPHRPNESTPRPNEAAGRTSDVNGGLDDADATGADLTTADDSAQDDAAPAADALAMLMSWLVPVAPPPTTDASVGTVPSGSTELAASTIVPATVGTGETALPLNLNGGAVPQDASAAPAMGAPVATGADVAASPVPGATIATAGSTTATDGAAGTPFSTTLTSAASATAGAVVLPDGMTLTPDDVSMARTADAATAAATASVATTAAVATGPASAQATGAATTDLASLAADFGAQIVATSGTTTARAASSTDALADDAQNPTTGSTARAAGAVSATSVQLPGQAVAAAGAAGQGTSATLAEAPEAGPEPIAAGQPASDAPTEFTGMLGATGTGNSTPTQAATSVQASAATAPPLTTQIVDGAMLAARRIGQSVEMVLQPEGLGAVTLRVTLERGGLGVHLAVENPQAREMVQASWPQLQQALEQRGLSVQSMMLDLSSGRGGDGFQAFQQFSGQQFSGQQARGGSNNGDRRGSPALATSDERPHVQTRAGTSARVDYRI